MNNIIKVAQDSIQIQIESLSLLQNSIDQNYHDVIVAITECTGKLVVSGMGKSGLIGKKISATLSSTGTQSVFLHPGEAFHGDLGMVNSKDIILLLSFSGETEEVIRLFPFFRANGNKVISITGNEKSTMAQNSDFHLKACILKEACPLELAPTSSTTSTLVLGDAIAISLMLKKDFKDQDFAKFHPGGNLGKRLLLKVHHKMKTENLPIIRLDSNFNDLIINITEGKIGASIVLDGDEKIVGIITDGDLRRYLLERTIGDSDFSIEKIMSKSPKMVNSIMSIIEAEKILIENKISTLLVTDDGIFLKGIVQLYGLYD
jgi:arabinose-5-phosphate isomerase